MDSPQMYDGSELPGLKKVVQGFDASKQQQAAPQGLSQQVLVNHVQQQHQPQLSQHIKRYTELADLNSPEISLDLQNLIDDTQFGEGLFSEILNPKAAAAAVVAARQQGYQQRPLPYMPSSIHFEPPIKEEPVESEFRSYAGASGGYQQGQQLHQANGGSAGQQNLLKSHLSSHHQASSGSRKHGKSVDKNTDEYKRRRERNNIAVRKSREKAKLRSRETEERVKLLVKENERLQKRIELLTEELNVLRSLFTNVGVLPEHLHRELNKHLDSYQQSQQQQQQSGQ